MRHTLLPLLLALTLPLLAEPQNHTPAKTQKPNIILFFIDDLGWADLGLNGSTFYETPHLDKLAQGGINLTQSYSANPVCSPTRSALMTGRAPQRLGITQWIPQPSKIHLRSSENTIAETLKKHGYNTGYCGKWHLGHQDQHLPTSQGYDWMKATNRAGQPGSYFHPYKRTPRRNSKRPTNGIKYWDIPDMEHAKPDDYLTDKLTDHALHFIDSQKNNPFFLTIAHYAVHTPIQSPKNLVQKYKNKRQKTYADTPTPSIPDRYHTLSRARQDSPEYAAMIENLDTNVGRVISHLQKNNLLQNTLIIFTSDNGGHCHLHRPGYTSNLPLRSGKGWTYEGGIRVPHLIYWQGKLTPATCTTPTITMDIFPTLLDLANLPLEPQNHLDGHSLKSALLGKPNHTLTQRFIAWTYPHSHGSGHEPSHAIRQGQWKLIHFEKGTKYELYDLENDPGEKQNLAEKNPQLVKTLSQKLTRWIQETTPEKIEW